MILFKHRAARATGAAVTLLGAIVLAGPSFAASGEMLAQASSQQAMAAPASESAQSTSAVEAHIRDLHKRLRITDAQKPQWEALVKVMRDNAQAMTTLQKERAADAQSMNAVDVVKSYASVVEAHEDGMKKFIPPFEALYNTMSDSQKKTADSLFRSRERTGVAKQTAANK
jgi:protein CpxP